MGGWVKLPDHLLDLVLKKLNSSIDYLQFAATCASWNSLVKFNKFMIWPSLEHQVPKLLLPSDEENICDVYDVISNKFTGLKQFVPHNSRFSGSSNGWLVVVNSDHTVTLHRSYFIAENDDKIATTVHLPCLFPLEGDIENFPENIEESETVFYPSEYNAPEDFEESETVLSEDFEEVEIVFPLSEYHVRKVVVSADPIASPEDCVVAVIHGEHRTLAIFRLAADTSWTEIGIEQDQCCMFEDLLYHNNRLYAMSFDELIVVDVPVGSGNPVVTVVVPSDTQPMFGNKQYLVKSPKEELWLVSRRFNCNWETDESRVTEEFRVFKLDACSAKWIEIKSLGDVALFLGDNTSISVSASSSFGCEPNCIYFTHDEDDITNWTNTFICDLGIYNVVSKNIHWHCGIDSTALGEMYKQPPIWLVPAMNI